MKKYLSKVFLYGFYFVLIYVALLFIVSSSTLITPAIESTLKLNGWEQGSIKQRTKELNSWINQNSSDKVLLIGSSSSYRNINPFILDSTSGVNSFNAGSAGMPVGVAYYLVKSIASETKLEHVVVEINPLVWGNFRIRTAHDWILNSSNPFEDYVIDLAFERGSFREFLYLSYRMVKYLNPISQDHFKAYDEETVYVGKGMECFKKTAYKKSYGSRTLEWSADNLKHIDKLVDFCKKNNIGLTLLVTPTRDLDYNLNKIQNYNRYILNMNNFKINPKWFNDEVHLNCKGSSPYSVLLSSELNIKTE